MSSPALVGFTGKHDGRQVPGINLAVMSGATKMELERRIAVESARQAKNVRELAAHIQL